MADRAKVPFDKPIDGGRVRIPAHITESPSAQFGIEVQVNRHVTERQEAVYPSGHGSESAGQEGQRQSYRGGDGPLQPGNQNYREVIPPGSIGTREKWDVQLPPPQYVDTVPSSPTEQAEPRLHGAMAALRAADTQAIAFQQYADFQPRSAPMPRALQDEAGFSRGVVDGKGTFPTTVRLGADPLMTDENSFTSIIERDDILRKDLYGDNVAGMLHNSPGNPTGMGTNPPDSATDKVIPQSKYPNMRNNVTLGPPTVTRPTTSMKGEPRGNQRAKR